MIVRHLVPETSNLMDSRFRVELIAATPNPQQSVYAGMHQDYRGFVVMERDQWPNETRAGKSASSVCWEE